MVRKNPFGGELGKSCGNSSLTLKTPSWKGVYTGPWMSHWMSEMFRVFSSTLKSKFNFGIKKYGDIQGKDTKWKIYRRGQGKGSTWRRRF